MNRVQLKKTEKRARAAGNREFVEQLRCFQVRCIGFSSLRRGVCDCLFVFCFDQSLLSSSRMSSSADLEQLAEIGECAAAFQVLVCQVLSWKLLSASCSNGRGVLY